MDSIEDLLAPVDQLHLLTFYDELTERQKASLENDIRTVNWLDFIHNYREEVKGRIKKNKLLPLTKIDESLVQKLPDEIIGGPIRMSQDKILDYYEEGQVMIKEGRCAALVLAGGQGTRLGLDKPKGMMRMELEVGHKSLFELYADRIKFECLKAIKCDGPPTIIWYVMVSEFTAAQTKDHFDMHGYFGLEKENVVFFQQDSVPSMDLEGHVLLESKHKIAKSPNGNGGLFEALHKHRIIDHMEQNEVQYVHVFSVDNVLTRICDPAFLAFFAERDAEVGCKVTGRRSKENVGLVCKMDGKFKVIEYSELPESLGERIDPETGKFYFNTANIAEHFYTVDFLKRVCGHVDLPYHLAFKKIPHFDIKKRKLVKPEEPNGIKMEKFIFDVFELTDNFVAWDVRRNHEFAPIKSRSGPDSVEKARDLLWRAYEDWVIDK